MADAPKHALIVTHVGMICPDDMSDGPSVVLTGGIEAIKEAAKLWGDEVRLVAAPQWRPIETAPMDGSVILAGYWRAEGWFSALYDAEADTFDADNHGFSRNVAPLTHWMPVPAAPKGDA